METPKYIKSVLKKLNKSESELGEYCIDKVADVLKENGYEDSRLWARNILSAVIGGISEAGSPVELEELVLESEGMEREVIEAIYDTFNYLEDELAGTDPMHIRDTIIHTVTSYIDKKEKTNYRRLYG